MGCCISIQSGQVGAVEKWGKFSHVVQPGLNFINPCTSAVRKVDMRLQQLKVVSVTKTLDNVFVSIEVSIHYRILPEFVKESIYEMSNPEQQIRAYVHDVVRAEVPKKTLDEIFVVKEELAFAIKTQLKTTMEKYGYEINATPVTDIDPDRNVKAALNEKTRQMRLKEAAEETAEGTKIVRTLEAEAHANEIRIRAEAEADAKYQSGLGLSRQRQAIVDGLSESVRHFQEGVPGVDSKTVMDLILVTQYFDMMQHIGTSKTRGTNTIFIPHNPANVADISSQIRQGFMESSAAPLETEKDETVPAVHMKPPNAPHL